MLVVLTLREDESGATEAAAVTEKGPAEAPVQIIIKCLEAGCLERTPLFGRWRTSNTSIDDFSKSGEMRRKES